jgi:kumamolisin
MGGNGWARWSVVATLGAFGILAACVSDPTKHGPSTSEETASVSEALSSTPNLQLQAETSACPANQAFDYFQVTNASTSSVKASDITIKLWVDDTTGQNIVGQINTGGCLNNGNGCFHQLSGVSINAVHLAQACGPDPTHQANWEVTISTTDTTAIAPGVKWANLQSAVHLANYANFSPGTADWYSPCLSGNTFQYDTHFAVYFQGKLVTSSPGIPPVCRATTGTMQLSGHVIPGLGTTFPLVGPLPVNTPVNLSIGLPLNTTPAGLPSLSSFIQQVSDPTGTTYRQFLAPGVFASQYGANAGDYTTLQGFAGSNGLKVTSTHTSRSVLAVTAPAATIESAFFVTLNVYKRPDGSTFYAPANDPSVNLTLTNAINHVAGLDNFAVPVPSSAGSSTETCPSAGANSQAGIFGTDVRKLYLGGEGGAGGTGCATTGTSADFGGGQTIGLLELDRYAPADITSYQIGNGLGTTIPNIGTFPTNFTQFVVPNTGGTIAFNAAPGFATGSGESEVALDLEMVVAMAPQANVVVYEWNTSTGAPNYDEILQSMAEPLSATSPPPQVLANSWTWPAAVRDPVMQQTFLQFAAQGQSFFQAAGDLGAYSSTYPGQKTGLYDANGVPDPIGESVLMTVVGGTQFAATIVAQEQAWNDLQERQNIVCGGTSVPTASCASAGGGGFLGSELAVPVYQSNYLTTMTALGLTLGDTTDGIGTSTTRMIPDVAMVADSLATFTGGTVSTNGTTTQGSATCSQGTSAAAVLWASYVAVANALHPQLPGLTTPASAGFANPTLYGLAASTSSPFKDITAGNNAFKSTSSAYPAASFYDLATGLGSPATSCGLVTGLPEQSCQPGTSVTALVNRTSATAGNVTAVFPRGSYNEQASGIFVVEAEAAPIGAAAATLVAPFELTTTDVLNTCAGDSTTQNVVCVSNATNAYVINVGTLLASEQSSFSSTLPLTGNSTLFQSQAASGHQEAFSGGNCTTCNATIDPVRHTAYLSIATSSDNGNNGTTFTGAAIQAFNISTATPTALSQVALGQQATSEDILVDPFRGYLLSPNESSNAFGTFETTGGAGLGDFQIINTFTGVAYDNFLGSGVTGTVPTAGIMDSAAEDCVTGVAISTIESSNVGGTASIVLLDLTKATFTAPTGGATVGTWTAPGQYVPLTGMPSSTGFTGPTGFESATAGVAVVEPGNHLAVITSEFGGNQFAIVQLPSSPGTLSTTTSFPTVIATMPSDPGNNTWAFGEDPHEITAYRSPNNGHSYAIFEQDQNGDGTRSYIAVVDLTDIFNNSSTSPTNCKNLNTIVTTGTGAGASPTDGTCQVRFIGGLN